MESKIKLLEDELKIALFEKHNLEIKAKEIMGGYHELFKINELLSKDLNNKTTKKV